MNIIKLSISTIILLSLFSCTKSINQKELRGNYLGQTAPGDSAIIFAKNLISTEFNVRDAAFSPDGNEFFYSLKGTSFYTIIHVNRMNGIWQNPEVASFSGNYSDIEPCFSYDGKKLFFVSNRPVNNMGEPKDYDIWLIEKENDHWGEPKNIGAPINTEANEFYPSFTKDGTMYYCAKYDKGIGGEDLYYSKFIDDKYQTPINLGDSVNSARDEFNSFVSPDERFIMFTSTGWGAGFGGGDLWISFRKVDNGWTHPKNMGDKINSSFFEYCPSLTPDGKYLFFTSNKTLTQKYSVKPLNYKELINGLKSTLNGSQNIYWISSNIIKDLNN